MSFFAQRVFFHVFPNGIQLQADEFFRVFRTGGKEVGKGETGRCGHGGCLQELSSDHTKGCFL
jgi:hypothetical protein